jgi:hypothetical protein
MNKKAKIDKLKFWSSGVEYIKFNITTYWKGENYGNPWKT